MYRRNIALPSFPSNQANVPVIELMYQIYSVVFLHIKSNRAKVKL